jgi:hypothetical protein
MEKALAAKTALQDKLRTAGIAASCGVTKRGDLLALKANLSDGSRVAHVPRSMQGTPVVVEVIGKTRAKGRR